LRVRFNGPGRFRKSVNDPWVTTGGEVNIAADDLARLQRQGYQFSPVDKRQNLPEPEPAPSTEPVVTVEEPETTEPDEP
jgi:hypothetical protein